MSLIVLVVGVAFVALLLVFLVGWAIAELSGVGLHGVGEQVMRAATYCRKSTSQEKGLSGASLRIERQRDLARAFAAARGWDVVADFADDAISGADFVNRDGLVHMLAAAQQAVLTVKG